MTDMRLKKLLSLLSFLAILAGCERGEMGYSFTDNSQKSDVVIFYAAAANDISYLIGGNIKTVKSGSLPQEGSKKVLLLFPHMDSSNPSYLQNIKRDEYGALKIDTLYTVEAGRSALEVEVMRAVLQSAYDNFPKSHFTLILSSHGTGWLPKGYYNNPETSGGNIFYMKKNTEPSSYTFPQFGPITKTFGIEQSLYGGTLEMEITDLASAIPMHLKCIVFDACLLGGVEVAYELRNLCDKICFSSAEVPGRGYNYDVLTSELLADDGTPEGFSKAYFDLWSEHPDYGATSTTVVCNGLHNLATLCKELFEKYRTEIFELRKENVQGFYRSDRHFFFDLEDILVKAGIDASEKAALKDALDACISYKEASPSFMLGYGGFRINTFCGMSMYLPSSDIRTVRLDGFYKTLAWNKATELVK